METIDTYYKQQQTKKARLFKTSKPWGSSFNLKRYDSSKFHESEIGSDFNIHEVN